MYDRDENDLTDAEVKAMWDEGESVALAASVVVVDPSPWVIAQVNAAHPAEVTVVRGVTL
jgi:hypothetical protein